MRAISRFNVLPFAADSNTNRQVQSDSQSSPEMSQDIPEICKSVSSTIKKKLFSGAKQKKKKNKMNLITQVYMLSKPAKALYAYNTALYSVFFITIKLLM